MIFKTLKNEASGFLNRYKAESPASYAAAQEAVGGMLILDGLVGIDNPFEGKNRPGIFGTLITIVFGIMFLFVPTIFGNITGINKMTATTTGTVVSNSQQQSTITGTNGQRQTSTTCSATAKYTVNGKEYTQQSSMSSSGMCALATGQSVQVYYNPSQPTQWATDVKTVGNILKLFFWAGIVVIIVGIFTFCVRLLSIIFGWKLLRNGRALAKTLPSGTDLSTVVNEIKQEFSKHVFSFGSLAAPMPQAATATTVPSVPAAGPTAPAPVVAPNQEPPIVPPTDNNNQTLQ